MLCVLQMNAGFFSALNLKTEMEIGQGADTSEAAQYLSRIMKRPMPDKPSELWRTYLRRYLKSSNIMLQRGKMSLYFLNYFPLILLLEKNVLY